MTIPGKFRIGNLIAEFNTNTAVFFSMLQTAGAETSIFFHCFQHLFHQLLIGIQMYVLRQIHTWDSLLDRCAHFTGSFQRRVARYGA